ncbi:hypothetical protein [Rhodopirellula bahusiensis]|uniref:Uncharacterized protein n=1 Tax=Rhodopirellula bahusiensis TaxID=2014065 RepID=A0A2G1W605_9BACT|nr:hypothetical protein [Rhodopirellula bahusiensis]PHQ34458.1 hypothetical protein CEE69_15780 [Rhodopirellula bahusiensis]
MLFLVIVAFVATTAFYAKARRSGLQPGRAAMMPFIVLGLFMVFAFFAGVAISQVVSLTQASNFTENAIRFMLNAFLIVGYLAFIRRNWSSLLSRMEDGI